MFNAHNPTASSTSAAFTASADPPFAWSRGVLEGRLYSLLPTATADMTAPLIWRHRRIASSLRSAGPVTPDSSSMDASSPDTPLQQLPSFSLSLSHYRACPPSLSHYRACPPSLSHFKPPSHTI
ncbi:hypothetical protein CLOM_g13009 [Closterium sp. NIES-68]|nr:hypothetical protein CLOM_g13009 [Closterium sp. NIES-68]